MATIINTGVMTYVDEYGNHQVLYPVTTADAVNGLSEALDAARTVAENAERNAILYAASLHFVKQITIPKGVWTGTAPYTVTMQVNDILASDTPHYSVVYSSDAATRLLEKESFAMIDDLETGKNSVTFTCFEEKPEVTLKIQLEVNR